MKWIRFSPIAFLFLLACSQPARKPEVNNGPVQIAYDLAGHGDTALVLVHGWCINKEYWQSQVDHFKNRYTVVALDLGGHGQSGRNRSEWTIESYANDVLAVIRALDLKKVILIGHSMGGDIILQTAQLAPERVAGFVGIDNFKDVLTSIPEEEQKGIDAFFAAMRNNYDSVATAYSRSSLFPPAYTDTVSVNRVVQDVRNADPTMAIATLESLLQFAMKETTLLPKLGVPVHLVVSDYTPTNDIAVRYYCPKGLYIYTVHGTGHYPMIEKPAEFNSQLAAALQDIALGK